MSSKSESLCRYSLEKFKSGNLKLAANGLDIRYEPGDFGLAADIADNLAVFLRGEGIDVNVYELDEYKHSRDLYGDEIVKLSLEDLLDLDARFNVIVRYGDHPESLMNSVDFSLQVKGGRTLIFTLAKNMQKSALTGTRIFELVFRLFFKYDGMIHTDITPEIDLNFILLSEERKVSWNFKEDIIVPYFYPLLNSLSLFYDVNLHSRIISGVNMRKLLNLNGDELEDDKIVFSLRDQGSELFDFLEGVTNVEIMSRDSHKYTQSFGFVVFVPSTSISFLDDVSNLQRDSFMIKNWGIMSVLNVNENAHHLSRDDARTAVSTWIPYLRKLHNLPTSLNETLLSILNGGDSVVRLDDTSFKVVTGDGFDDFSVRFDTPDLVAFYGFEVAKIARSLHELYTRGAIENLEKTIKSIPKLDFMVRVPKSTAHFVENAILALEGILKGGTHEKVRSERNSAVSLALARVAFSQSLEALGDDRMFTKNLVSREHSLATFMCDIFPYLFPLLMSIGKFIYFG